MNTYEQKREHQIGLYRAAANAVNAAIEAGSTKARRASRTWGIWMYEKELERLERVIPGSASEEGAIALARQAITELIEFTKTMH